MTWRIIHISDLHFCATARRANALKYVKRRVQELYGGLERLTPEMIPAFILPDSYCPDLVRFLARKIYQMRNEIDVLLISGDIATTGLPEDLRLGLQFVDAQPSRTYLGADGRATVKSGRFPIMLIPGNHDRFRSNRGEPGSRTFDLIFDGHWGRTDPEILTGVFSQPHGPSLAIVGADLTLRSEQDAGLPTRVMRYGQGCAYEDVIKKLTAKTADLHQRFPGVGVIWTVHFPPSKDCCGFFGYKELRFHPRLVHAATISNVSLVLCGHIHERKLISLDDLTIVCAGSASVFAEEHGNWFHCLEISIENGRARLTKKSDYLYLEEEGDFVRAA